MFGVGPAYLFHPAASPAGRLMRGGWQPWLSTMATNAAIALVAAGMIWAVGVVPFLLVHLPIMLIGGVARGLAVLRPAPVRRHVLGPRTASGTCTRRRLYGSSHYDLPRVLRWFTANIGMHHIHHLCSRIPFYRLPLALRRHPELANVGRLTLGQSFPACASCCGTKRRSRLITFRELRTVRDASGRAAHPRL